MGVFSVPIAVTNPHTLASANIAVLVDNQSAFTVIPISILRRLHVEPAREIDFISSDDLPVQRSIAWVLVSVAGRQSPTPVVFGLEGDHPALGRITLAELGLAVDQTNGTLVQEPGRLKELALVT